MYEIILSNDMKLETINAIEYFIDIAEKERNYITKDDVIICVDIFKKLDKTLYPLGKRCKRYSFVLFSYYYEYIKKCDESRKFYASLFNFNLISKNNINKDITLLINLLKN